MDDIIVAPKYRSSSVHTYSNGAMGCAFFADYPIHYFAYMDGEKITIREPDYKTQGLVISCDSKKEKITFHLSNYQFTKEGKCIGQPNETYIPHCEVSFPAHLGKEICLALIQMGFGK